MGGGAHQQRPPLQIWSLADSVPGNHLLLLTFKDTLHNVGEKPTTPIYTQSVMWSVDNYTVIFALHKESPTLIKILQKIHTSGIILIVFIIYLR